MYSSAFLHSSSGYSSSFGGSGPKELAAGAGGFVSSLTEAFPKTSSKILTPSFSEASSSPSAYFASSLLSSLTVVSLFSYLSDGDSFEEAIVSSSYYLFSSFSGTFSSGFLSSSLFSALSSTYVGAVWSGFYPSPLFLFLFLFLPISF